jgi:tellurite resistance protein TerC
VSVPAWAWVAFAAFVVAMLALDLLVLHRRAREVSLRQAAGWTAVWLAIGLGFGGLLWAWQGGNIAQDYLAGYLIEKSLSLDNVFVFAVIFSALAIPARYQQRVLMFGIVGALVMRAVFIVAGVTLLEAFHPVSYLFGAVLLYAAVRMLRAGAHAGLSGQGRVLRAMRRVLPTTERLHGQRFVVRDGGRLLATPLLVALVVVEVTDLIFAVDSIPAVLAVTTDTFVVYTSNVFAVLGMRALYFLLAGAASRFRYLRPGLAIILAAVAVKLVTADLYEVPAWTSPAFIAVVLAAVAILSIRDRRPRPAAPAADRPAPTLRAGLGAGQGEGQYGALPGLADGGQVPAVGPGSGICGADRDGDQAAGRGELQRVGQQVGDDLVQPARVAVDLGRDQLPPQADPGRLEPSGQAVGGRGRQAGQVAGAAVQVQRGGVGGGQILQVGHHPGQPQHLIAQRGQLGRGGLGDPVQQGLVPDLQDRDRGAQLVGDIGDQVAAQLFLPVHRAGHLVERGGQLAHLARAGDPADPDAALPAGHPAGHRDDLLDRAGDPPGDGQPGQHGQQRGQPGRARDGPQQRRPQRVVGAGQAGAGEPDVGLPGPLAPHHDRRADLRARRLRGEAGRGRDDRSLPVADLDVGSGAPGQI